MALKGSFDRQEDVPEFLREHAVEHDGRWVLEVEGFASKPIIDEMRASNRTMKTENDTLKKDLDVLKTQFTDVQTRYKDVDLDEYKLLKAAPTDVQKEIAAAEKRWQAKLEEQVGEERKRREVAEQRYQQEQIGNEVAKYLPKVGAWESALDDLKGHAIKTFKMIDGKTVPFDGDTPRYSEKEPSKLLGMEEWLGTMMREYPHYAKPSSGGGAAGGIGGRIHNGRMVIPGSDSKAFIANLEKIAKGEVEVDLSA
jgi:hypothetical protein